MRSRLILALVAVLAAALVPAPPAAAQQKTTLVVTGYGGRWEEVMKKALVEPFEKKHVLIVVGADQICISSAHSGAERAHLLMRGIDAGHDNLQHGLLSVRSEGFRDKGFGPVA